MTTKGAHFEMELSPPSSSEPPSGKSRLLDHLRVSRPPPRGSKPEPEAAMAVLVSLAVLGAALFVILSHNYEGASEKWAFGAVGTLLGYWLKTRK
jgi:hypothetical protein